MNLIAFDIGFTYVKVGFFLDDTEQQLVCFSPADEGFQERLGRFLEDCWEQVPLVASAAEPTRNGVIVVSSVNPEMTERVRQICLSELGEKIKVIGQDVPLPIETSTIAVLDKNARARRPIALSRMRWSWPTSVRP